MRTVPDGVPKARGGRWRGIKRRGWVAGQRDLIQSSNLLPTEWATLQQISAPGPLGRTRVQHMPSMSLVLQMRHLMQVLFQTPQATDSVLTLSPRKQCQVPQMKGSLLRLSARLTSDANGKSRLSSVFLTNRLAMGGSQDPLPRFD